MSSLARMASSTHKQIGFRNIDPNTQTFDKKSNWKPERKVIIKKSIGIQIVQPSQVKNKFNIKPIQEKLCEVIQSDVLLRLHH